MTRSRAPKKPVRKPFSAKAFPMPLRLVTLVSVARK